MQISLALDRMLHEKYALKDEKYDVPESTFEITKKDGNVEAVNIIPGEDTVYFDCRILPNYDVDEVLSEIMKVIAEFEKNTGAKISLEVLQKQVSKDSKSADSEIVVQLKKALKDARGLEARVGGLGGGTCAAFFRKAGFPAVVWSTVDEVAHQSSEYSKVQNMVNDAKVFALLALS
jgi:succinyl-diaminopimelate desuccinylase